MWLLLSLAAALFQVLRNTTMKRLGHSLDEYINVWGRFTFLLPFAFIACVASGWPELKPGFFVWCLLFGVCQTLSTLALSKALKLSQISLVTALWKVSLLILLGMGVLIGEQPSAMGVAGGWWAGAGWIPWTTGGQKACPPLRRASPSPVPVSGSTCRAPCP